MQSEDYQIYQSFTSKVNSIDWISRKIINAVRTEVASKRSNVPTADRGSQLGRCALPVSDKPVIQIQLGGCRLPQPQQHPSLTVDDSDLSLSDSPSTSPPHGINSPLLRLLQVARHHSHFAGDRWERRGAAYGIRARRAMATSSKPAAPVDPKFVLAHKFPEVEVPPLFLATSPPRLRAHVLLSPPVLRRCPSTTTRGVAPLHPRPARARLRASRFDKTSFCNWFAGM